MEPDNVLGFRTQRQYYFQTEQTSTVLQFPVTSATKPTCITQFVATHPTSLPYLSIMRSIPPFSCSILPSPQLGTFSWQG
jgi:hypothetical protein